MIRTYRYRPLVTIQLIFAAGFMLLGIAMLIPARGTEIAEHVIGGVVLVCGGTVGAACLTNRVMLTPAGIAYRYNFRLKTIPWDAVESFKVSPFPGNTLWSTVRVQLRPSGYAYAKGVWGTKRYAQRLVAGFEEYRAQLPADLGTRPDATQGTQPHA